MAQVVSPYNNARIDIRVLILIGLCAVSVQCYVEFSDDPELFIMALSLASQMAVGIFALLVSKRYWGSRIFGRSYLLLAVAYFFVFAGEVTYNAYVFVLDADPHPSVADLFFFMVYPFSLGHIMINVRSFRARATGIEKVWIAAISASLVMLFVCASYATLNGFNFDAYYGMLFVSGAAVIMAFGVYGIAVTRNMPLGRMWLLLVAGIMFGTVADIWYHHQELLEEYETSGVVNVFWYLSYWFIIYSLYKHQKII